jgi:cobalt-zinc-cadmium efflux system outer membrane protein
MLALTLPGCRTAARSVADWRSGDDRAARSSRIKADPVGESSDAPAGYSQFSTVRVGRQVKGAPVRSDDDTASEIVQVAAGDPQELAADDDVARGSKVDPAVVGKTATRLEIPADLPGADAHPIELSSDSTRRHEEIEQIFGMLPNVVETRVRNSQEGLHYSLAQLQAMAISTNPVLVQADAQITTARGAALQAGLHPNPVIGYEADTVGSGGTPNYHGGYVNTVIKTPGKLDLAESAANVDVWNADLMRKKIQVELVTQVRGAYYAALIARENVKIAEALVAFTDSVYRNQVDRLKGGLVSASEPVQLRALAVQARTALAQARNRYDAAWRQLAASVGIPDLPPGYLEGDADIAVESIDYDKTLAYMLANHTDVQAAHNSEIQARTNLRLQELNVTPDLLFYMALQKDYTTGPVYRATYNMQIGVPVPIFDRNQGNILNAQGVLLRSAHEAPRVRNDLANKLADAIERYENARNLTELYQANILPDQARAFRGLYERHQQQPDVVGFVDVVNAQQTLLSSINTYINTLALRWGALTDIGALLQIESIEGIQALLETGAPIPVNPEVRDDLPTLLPEPAPPRGR